MSYSPHASGKVCIACGQDCSARPRVRDKQGRYMCRPCADSRARAGANAPAAPAADDHSHLALEPLEVAAARSARGARTCSECGSSMPFGACLCVQCGFDAARGRRLETNGGPEHTGNVVAAPRGAKECPTCGYSLKGLQQPKCPECGGIIVRETEGERRAREDAQVRRRAYITSVVMFLIGPVTVFVIGAVFGGAMGIGALVGISRLIFFLVPLAVATTIATVIYLACAFLWIGFGAPIHLQIMRLAGVCSVTMMIAGGSLLIPIPIPFVPMVIPLLCFAGMLSKVLDIERRDAVIVAVLTFVACFIVLAIVVFAAWGGTHP